MSTIEAAKRRISPLPATLSSIIYNIKDDSYSQYYLINNRLKETFEHPIFVKRNSDYLFVKTENLLIGDYVFNSNNEFEIVDSISILNEINPVSFNWKDNGKKSYGVIAQEIEEILPDIVDTNPDTGIKSVSYLQLISFLIDAVKQQQVEINMIKQELGSK
jgi:hypothetical protein